MAINASIIDIDTGPVSRDEPTYSIEVNSASGSPSLSEVESAAINRVNLALRQTHKGTPVTQIKLVEWVAERKWHVTVLVNPSDKAKRGTR